MMTNSTDFAKIVAKFLTEYLPCHRCYSKNTILSYRDTLKLFLKFIKEEKNMSVNSFYMKDFNRDLVINFLEWYRGTGASISAANQRLAAIKAFSDFAQLEKIEYIEPLQNIAGIKSKKSAQKDISYLNTEQMAKLINSPDVNTAVGLRHRMILALMYDSGCRVQELCNIKIADISLEPISTVTLHGKGNKIRTVVISDETASIIRNYIKRYRQYAIGTDFLITNRFNHSINRDGISYIVKKYAGIISRQDASFPKHVHCHMFRHSKAMHMLEAGINIVYIRDFLGHEDISTTMIYVRADNRLKNEAISKLAPLITESATYQDWNKDQDLMQFLNSLK